MSVTQTANFRMAAEGLILTDAQKHILAYRLTRKLVSKEPGTLTVPEMLNMIDCAMCDMQTGVETLVISEDSYRENRVLAT